MDVLQQVASLGRHIADQAAGIVRGRNTVCLYVSNGTNVKLLLTGEPVVKGGSTCISSFDQLLPGRAGCVRLSNAGAVEGSVVMDVDGEKLTCQASNSRMSKPKVEVSFDNEVNNEMKRGSFSLEATDVQRRTSMERKMSSGAKLTTLSSKST